MSVVVLQKLDELLDFVDDFDFKHKQQPKVPYRIVTKENDKGDATKMIFQEFEMFEFLSSMTEDDVLIQVKAAGINFIDTYQRSGLYPNPSNQLGKEGSGIIINIGNNVKNWNIKDYVCWFGIQGSYATHIKINKNFKNLIKIPSFLIEKYKNDEKELFNIGAAIPLQCLTCHYLCCDIMPCQLNRRESVSIDKTPNILVHAGAGGCGSIIIQILKNVFKIPNVITTVGNQAKLKIALNNGADHGIIYTLAKYNNNNNNNENDKNKDGDNSNGIELLSNDILDKCINNTKCQIIYDGVGLNTWQVSLKCCDHRGLIVYFGNASGKVPPINPLLLTKHGSVNITRPTLADYVRTKEELDYRINDIFQWIQNGQLKINIGNKLPLYQATKAHQLLETRRTTGKIILMP